MKEGSPDQEKEVRLAAMTKLLTRDIGQAIEHASKKASLKERVEEVLDDYEKRSKELFPEHVERLGGILNELRLLEFENKDEAVLVLADRLGHFLAEHFSLDDIEERIKNNFTEERGFTILNRLLAYEIDGSVASLHVPTIFVENPVELRSLFLSGMKELASRLVSDPGLSEVETVNGASWIIYQYPELLKRMGFEIIKTNDDDKVAIAEISRKQLLELYGKH